MNKAVRLAVVSFVISLVAYVLKYVLNVFLANHLSADIYGDVNMAFRALVIFSTLSLLGTTTSAKRFLSDYIYKNDKASAYGFIRWNIKLLGYTCLVCIGVAILSMLLFLVLDHYHIVLFESYHIAFYTLWIVPIAAVGMLSAGYLACDHYPVSSYAVSFIGKYVFLLVFFSISVYYFEISFTSESIMVLLAMSYAGLSLVEFFFLSKKTAIVKLMCKGQSFEAVPQHSEKEWFKVSSNLIMNSMVFLIVCILDLIIVEVFSGSEKDVGYYSAILAISGILWIIPQGIYQFVKPKISGLLSTESGKVKLQKLISMVNLVNLLITVIVTALLLIFAKKLLGHFGKEYAVAQTALYIAVLGTFLGLFSKSPSLLLVFSGFEGLVLKLNVVTMLLVIIFSIPLTVLYNYEGTAMGVAIVNMINVILSVYFLRKKVGLKAYWIV